MPAVSVKLAEVFDFLLSWVSFDLSYSYAGYKDFQMLVWDLEEKSKVSNLFDYSLKLTICKRKPHGSVTALKTSIKIIVNDVRQALGDISFLQSSLYKGLNM